MNAEKLEEILKLKKLGMYEIEIEIPKAIEALNYRYGVIGPFGESVQAEELQEILEEEYAGIKVERIMVGRGEKRNKSTQSKLKFHAKELPEYVFVHYERVKVRQFIDQPWQCYNCQGFGHSAKFCNWKMKCLICSGEHKLVDCQQRNAIKRCANCGGNHVSNAPECEKVKREKEVQRIKCQNHIPYSKAVKRIQEEQRRKVNVEESRPGSSGVAGILRRDVYENKTMIMKNSKVKGVDMGTQTTKEATNTDAGEDPQRIMEMDYG